MQQPCRCAAQCQCTLHHGGDASSSSGQAAGSNSPSAPSRGHMHRCHPPPPAASQSHAPEQLSRTLGRTRTRCYLCTQHTVVQRTLNGTQHSPGRLTGSSHALPASPYAALPSPWDRGAATGRLLPRATACSYMLSHSLQRHARAHAKGRQHTAHHQSCAPPALPPLLLHPAAASCHAHRPHRIMAL